MFTTRTAARNLLIGDRIGNGTVYRLPYRNSQTPKGKVTVEYVNHKNELIVAHWNPSTQVGFSRESLQTAN